MSILYVKNNTLDNMKEFTKFFARRYSAVNCDDGQHLPHQMQYTNNERHKSLNTQCSMNPSGILNSFFNERTKNHRARSPTRKYA